MKKEVKKPSRAKHIILAAAIALVFVFFIAYAIESVYPSPKYRDYCEEKQFVKAIETMNECEAEGGKWTEFLEPREIPLKAEGYCDVDYTCSQKYETDKEKYERNVFIANIIFGILAIVLSFLLSVEAVSTGFMGGGLIMIIYASIRYWEHLTNVLQTLLLGIALAVLVWVGYKKLR